MNKLSILLAVAGILPLMAIGRASAHDVGPYERHVAHDRRAPSSAAYGPTHYDARYDDAYPSHRHADHWRGEMVSVAAHMADQSHRFARALSQANGWYEVKAPAAHVAEAAARFERIVASRAASPRQVLTAWRDLQASEQRLARYLGGERFSGSSYLRDTRNGFRAAFRDAGVVAHDVARHERYLARRPVDRHHAWPYVPPVERSYVTTVRRPVRAAVRPRGTVRRVP